MTELTRELLCSVCSLKTSELSERDEFSFHLLISQQSCLLIVSKECHCFTGLYVCPFWTAGMGQCKPHQPALPEVVGLCFLRYNLWRKLCVLWNCLISPESSQQGNISAQMRNRYWDLRETDLYDSSCE